LRRPTKEPPSNHDGRSDWVLSFEFGCLSWLYALHNKTMGGSTMTEWILAAVLALARNRRLGAVLRHGIKPEQPSGGGSCHELGYRTYVPPHQATNPNSTQKMFGALFLACFIRNFRFGVDRRFARISPGRRFRRLCRTTTAPGGNVNPYTGTVGAASAALLRRLKQPTAISPTG
jgi:hypothetical protein